MTEKPPTQAERVARIETLLDEQVIPLLTKLDAKVDADVADLARLKHRGAGILIGTSLAFTALGALLHHPIDAVMSLFR